MNCLRVVLVGVLACVVVATPATAGPGIGTDAPVGDADTSTAAVDTAIDGGGPTASDDRLPGSTVSSDATSTRAGGAALDGAMGVDGEESNIRLTQQLQLTPGRPGEITVTLTYRIPDQVTQLSTEIPPEATVVETNGFGREDGNRHAWTERTDAPTLTYQMPANVTRDGDGPIGGSGDYIFADVGPWALVRIPPTATIWGSTGPRRVSVVRERTTAGPGAMGESVAFLGEHRTHEHEAHGQRFRLVVPAASSMAESPADVFASLERASDVLRVGDRDEEVLLVAAPTDGVTWGVRGIQTGDADGWVRDRERLDDPTNVWVHEYVHTRQGWADTGATRWVTEATATYYAALLAVERGNVDFDSFRTQLGGGARPPQSESVLARPDSWQNAANYQKGALVAGELDRRIRLASDRRRSLQNVLRWMNERGDPVTGEAFLRMVGEAGNGSVRDAGERYTTTDAVPSTWGPDEHARAFGATPAYVEYALAGQHDVSGPYRNGTVSGRTVRLVPGETLTVRAAVSNSGGATDEYEATFRVDGERTATSAGQVDPNERKALTFSHTFAGTGTYTVAVGDSTLTVEVVRPATATVSDVTVDRSTVDPGDQVTLTATVGNDATVPGEATVGFRVDGRTVATREVRLDAGEIRTVSANTSFDEPGTYQVDAGGEAAATVTVQPTSITGDGFGHVVALTAVALLLVAGRRW